MDLECCLGILTVRWLPRRPSSYFSGFQRRINRLLAYRADFGRSERRDTEADVQPFENRNPMVNRMRQNLRQDREGPDGKGRANASRQVLQKQFNQGNFLDLF